MQASNLEGLHFQILWSVKTSLTLLDTSAILITTAHFLSDTHTKQHAKLFRNTKQLQETGNPGTQKS